MFLRIILSAATTLCITLPVLAQESATVPQTPPADSAAPINPDIINEAERKPSAGASTESPATQKTISVKSFQPSKRMSQMDYDEITEWLEDARKHNDDQLTLKLIDHALQKKPDYAVVQGLLLERADLLYRMERFHDSKDTYDKFYTLYPRCTDSERALSRAIECSKKLILDIEHDQTQTYETIRLADAFLECEIFTKHRKEVEEVRSFCYAQLFEYEARICRFHIFQANTLGVDAQMASFKSADTRLASINEFFPSKSIADFEKKVLELTQELNTAKTNAGIVIVTLDEKKESAKTVLDTDKTLNNATTPQQAPVKVAQTSKKPFVDRF